MAKSSEGVREDIRRWIADTWTLDLTVRAWWQLLADAGLTAPTWPPPYGRSMTAADARIVTEELAAAGTIAPPQGVVGTTLAGPTLLAHGTDEQRARYLPPMLRGEESWCQLFSEPGSGSDLSSVGTRALLDGDGWVVKGQKVWNSGADIARRGMLLARTDVDVPKADGITYFILDLDQRGVEVRPLVTLNGESRFCEVFLDDAVVAPDDALGELNDGWRVARTTLANERASVAARPAKGLVFVTSGEKAGHLGRRVGDVVGRDGQRRPSFSGNAVPARRLFDLARERGRADDPCIRQGLARYYTMTELNRYSQMRSPDPSLTKLAISRICRASRDLSFSIIGADSMLWGADAPYDGSLQTVGLASLGVSIGGGTDEVQRNLVAERALGLPREPEPDRDLPYRQLTVGTQR